jgi:hypothetical protein
MNVVAAESHSPSPRSPAVVGITGGILWVLALVIPPDNAVSIIR